MTNNTFTIYGHWVYEHRLSIDDILSVVVKDFAIKCANLIKEYQDISFLRFGLGIYDLFFKRWGIEGWIDKGYEQYGSCNSDEERLRYKLCNTIREQLYQYNLSDTLTDSDLYSILGAGELPFLSVYEYLDQHRQKYHYIYTISR